MAIEKYIHHGKEVSVMSELKGHHREHCLCFKCDTFNIENREKNCKIANLLYAVCCECDITTPVYECAYFIEKK